MGSTCGYCKSEHDNYFNAFFRTFKLKKVTDIEYATFIETIIVKKTSYYKRLKNESNPNPNPNQNPGQSHSRTKNDKDETCFDDISSNEFLRKFNKENKDFNTFKDTNPNSHEETELHLDSVQENLHNYIQDLVKDILNNFCYHSNLVAPKTDELFPDNEELHYLNDYVVKKEANKYFEFYHRYYTKQGKTLHFIIALIFFTKTSYKTIGKYLNKLFMLFFNVEILSEEGNCMYINMSYIKEVCEIYVRLSSCFSVKYVAAVLPKDQMTVEFQNFYSQVFSEKVICFFIENYFEFNFNKNISLAYFVKVIYSKIENENLVRYSLQETYTENKNFNEKIMKELKSG